MMAKMKAKKKLRFAVRRQVPPTGHSVAWLPLARVFAAARLYPPKHPQNQQCPLQVLACRDRLTRGWLPLGAEG